MKIVSDPIKYHIECPYCHSIIEVESLELKHFETWDNEYFLSPKDPCPKCFNYFYVSREYLNHNIVNSKESLFKRILKIWKQERLH